MLRHPTDVVASWLDHERDAPILPVKLEEFSRFTTDTLRKIGEFVDLELTDDLSGVEIDAERPSKASENLTTLQRREVWKAVGSFYERFGYSERS